MFFLLIKRLALLIKKMRLWMHLFAGRYIKPVCILVYQKN